MKPTLVKLLIRKCVPPLGMYTLISLNFAACGSEHHTLRPEFNPPFWPTFYWLILACFIIHMLALAAIRIWKWANEP